MSFFFQQTCVCALGYTEEGGACVSLSTLDCSSAKSLASQVRHVIYQIIYPDKFDPPPKYFSEKTEKTMTICCSNL